MNYKYLLAVSAVLALSACGGSSNPGGSDTGGSADGGAGGGSGISLTIDDYNKLEPAAIEPTVLEPATEESLKQLLTNSLRVRTLLASEPVWIAEQPVSVNEPTSAPESDGASDPSDTNTIVEGVDEADYIKTDGQYLYIADQREVLAVETNPDVLDSDIPLPLLDTPDFSNSNGVSQIQTYARVVSMDAEQASVEYASTISFNEMESGNLPELLLNKNSFGETQSLIAVRSHYESTNYSVPCAAPEGAACLLPAYYSGKSTAQVAIRPALNQDGFERFFSFDGTIKTSRKIDNILYLVLSYTPQLHSLYHGVTTDDSVAENEEIMSGLSTEDLLPKVRIDGAEQNYLAANDCYIPKDISSGTYVNNLSSIVAIDLNDGSIRSSRCVNSPVQGIYASRDAIYLGGSNSFFAFWDSALTTLHKFDLGDGDIEYRSTGSVVGTMAWDSSDYSMDAKDGVLRIVTSSWQQDETAGFREHHVSVLRDSPDSDEMELLAQIPNEDRPEAIGKPNEQIESVRFRDDKAYIVTFLRTDPLYVVDLSNPEDPFVAGELEVPGYSKYLHLIDDTTLLGVGYDADDRGVNSGVKISLFDVSDDIPVEVESIVLGDSYSGTPATRNLHAISFSQPTADQVRFTFPATIYEDRTFTSAGLQLFEINGLNTNEHSLDFVGAINPNEGASSQSSYSIFYDRSVLFGDSVFYVHDGDVWTTFWDQSENASGPY